MMRTAGDEEVALPIQPLPENPSLENLRKKVKQLQKRVRAGDTEALARVREFHPRAQAALRDFKLSDAQLVAARTYSFPSWAKLKAHAEAIQPFVWNPPEATESLADEFLRRACVDYTSWTRSDGEKARQLLDEHPEVARANIYTAAAAGDVDAARSMLTNAKGGPHNWEPLLYACYSRVPGRSTLEVARMLIENGADPNAGFLWRGNVPPFTALTAAFGGGERGANDPPHQEGTALARLLLDAGADPNDDQTLYNRHFEPNDDHLKLLFSYGLGQDKGGPWFKRFGERLLSPSKMLVEQLWSAAGKNYVDRVKLLVEHGADVNGTSFRNGRTSYEMAVRAGNEEIAAYLLAHGAKTIALSDDERFAAACVSGRRDEALAMLAGDPSRVERLGIEGRVNLLHHAVEANHPDGIRLMAELGFEVSGRTRNTPLHSAAWNGNLVLVELLLELGADPNVRDAAYDGTPLDWAAYNGQAEVVEYLRRR
jgi:ankyrin repeat protein